MARWLSMSSISMVLLVVVLACVGLSRAGAATCMDGLCATDTNNPDASATADDAQQQQPAKLSSTELIGLEHRPASTPPLSPQSWYTHRFVHPSLEGVAGNSVAFGRPDALIQVFVFVDFACPVCVRAAEPMKHLMRNFAPAIASVQLVIMNLALASHRTALPAAVCSLAAARQGRYWDMFDQLVKAPFRDTEQYKVELAQKSGITDLATFRADLKDPMLAAQVRYESALANAVGITGTPGFWVGTRSLNGWASYFMFEQMVRQAVDNANRIRASASADELASDPDLVMKRLMSSNAESATFASYFYGIGIEQEQQR